jgi:hypothetical protein
MQLDAFCLRCERFYAGPDEGCPECDKGSPHVTSARNHILPGKPPGWDSEPEAEQNQQPE